MSCWRRCWRSIPDCGPPSSQDLDGLLRAGRSRSWSALRGTPGIGWREQEEPYHGKEVAMSNVSASMTAAIAVAAATLLATVPSSQLAPPAGRTAGEGARDK